MSNPPSEARGVLGVNVRTLRTSRGWTHRALADAADVSQAYVSDLETGRVTNPGVVPLYRIALVLNVTMEDLMGLSRLAARNRISDPRRPRKLVKAEPAEIDGSIGVE